MFVEAFKAGDAQKASPSGENDRRQSRELWRKASTGLCRATAVSVFTGPPSSAGSKIAYNLVESSSLCEKLNA
jgi:hypothetical protein